MVSIEVLMFHVPNFIVVHLSFDFRPHDGDPSGRGYSYRIVVKQTMFRAPFSSPLSKSEWVERILNRAVQAWLLLPNYFRASPLHGATESSPHPLRAGSEVEASNLHKPVPVIQMPIAEMLKKKKRRLCMLLFKVYMMLHIQKSTR